MAKRRRYYILLGDTTTHGGRVITARGEGNSTINGIPIACVGDLTTCPLCKGTHPILHESVYPPSTIDGVQEALEGFYTACGAQLIPSQTLRWHECEEDVHPLVASLEADRAAAKAAAAAQTAVEAQGSSAEETDEEYIVQYVIIDEKTNMPVKFDYAYCIRVDDGDEFVDKPAKDTAESRLVQRSEKIAVEMLPPIQLQIGV